MPSISHGGGGGSHFGGGGSSGGSHFGSSSSTRWRPIRTGPIFIHFGGRCYTMSSGKQTFSVFMIILTIFIAIIGIGFTFSTNSDKLKIIENDYQYYHEMVIYSEQHSNYTTTAQITNIGNKYGKYYYDYVFTDVFGDKVSGFTYLIYTVEDLESIHVGDNITIAINCPNNRIMSNTDSTPLDIKYYGPADDAEYVYLKEMGKRNRKFGIGTLIVAGVSLALTITLYIVFLNKVENQEAKKLDGESSSINTSKPVANYCAYCGKVIPNGEDSCSACGAKVTQHTDKK